MKALPIYKWFERRYGAGLTMSRQAQTHGLVDFDMKPSLERGVFRELKDERYFRRISILHGAVTWPHEQDIAPETLLVEMAPVQEAPLCR